VVTWLTTPSMVAAAGGGGGESRSDGKRTPGSEETGEWGGKLGPGDGPPQSFVV
jgi:hypothetical protein